MNKPEIVHKAVPRASSNGKKSMIIDSALALFAEYGFNGVPLRMIATYAGVPLSTLVYHFPDKKILYDQAVTRAFERTTNIFDIAVDDKAEIEVQLRHLMHRTMYYHLVDSPEMRLIDQALLDKHVSVNIGISNLLENNHENMKRLFMGVSQMTEGYEWHELREIFIGLCYGAVKFRRLQSQLMIGEHTSNNSDFIRKAIEFYISSLKASTK